MWRKNFSLSRKKKNTAGFCNRKNVLSLRLFMQDVGFTGMVFLVIGLKGLSGEALWICKKVLNYKRFFQVLLERGDKRLIKGLAD